MANAKKLTGPQIAALRAAVNGENVWTAAWRAQRKTPYRGPGTKGMRTIRSLLERELITTTPLEHGTYRITPAGRQALFEATGESASTPERCVGGGVRTPLRLDPRFRTETAEEAPPVKVYVVHSHERCEGSSIVLVTTNRRKAKKMEVSDGVDRVSVTECEIED